MPEARIIPLRPDDDEAYTPAPSAAGWEQQISGGMEFLRRRMTGDYETDEFGFDPDLTDHLLLPLLRPLFSKWFRVETQGLENVPSTGGGLVGGHHPRTHPLDAIIATVELPAQHPPEGPPRL